MLKKMPFFKQLNKFDCAPACVKMLLDFFEIRNDYSIEKIRDICLLDSEGTSIYNLNQALNKVGINSAINLVKINELRNIKLPVILFLNGNHFVILNKIKNNKEFHVTNPAIGEEIR